MIKVHIVEDHPVIINGLKGMFRPLRDNIEFVGWSETIEGFLSNYSKTPCDIVLLDLWLKDSKPMENVRQVIEQAPEVHIVIYTSEISPVWERKMILAGVKAYLKKSAKKQEIKLVLEKVFEGESVITGRWEHKDEKVLRRTLSGKTLDITAKQLEIVRLVSEGLYNKEIADAMKTSISTIDKKTKILRDELGAKTNAELVRILTEKGLL